ncbi:bifunctional folylpolyglutamate synthase/dihydrofolate synthase [Merismopedia glauca]|uniref:tetrahydrofolate synthase n=1 Tax=Merismopedia glauca CCAP 1448/3 TaxID=1296344 RepID=A0A2T1BXC6_9CYAN|nr:folylpolyglutamate synthase/dihydrofolate synthase family protein [Merismopedia glauca]PSB00666.1 bifunctional folylpolyglutamate synthase/dihydrofolate synthase [Merismopedia glauca CCAP 1448/3]
MPIDAILEPFQRFGVHLGLERIEKLLAALDNPHRSVPIIHVAGTNGKGSVCAYLSSILTAAGYLVGRYTSPHLVDWTERICLNGQPIDADVLRDLLLEVTSQIDHNSESPTQFEVITAAAFWYFAQQEVDVAIIEVGLGGRLDATNVCDRPLATIITSISREHWQQLGSTLAQIATEKAGILKPGCPAIIGSLPPEAAKVVEERIKQLDCPAIWTKPATYVDSKANPPYAESQGIKYPLPLLGEIQLSNSALAIATCLVLRQQGWEISDRAIAQGMSETRWLGRLQWTNWQNHQLLIDGAHNVAAAQALHQYVDTLAVPVNWVMGMLSTKDHTGIFEALLKEGDRLYLVPVPDHSSANPADLAILAQKICPRLRLCQTFPDLKSALHASTSIAKEGEVTVLCGSLYLLGHFLATQTPVET